MVNSIIVLIWDLNHPKLEQTAQAVWISSNIGASVVPSSKALHLEPVVTDKKLILIIWQVVSSFPSTTFNKNCLILGHTGSDDRTGQILCTSPLLMKIPSNKLGKQIKLKPVRKKPSQQICISLHIYYFSPSYLLLQLQLERPTLYKQATSTATFLSIDGLFLLLPGAQFVIKARIL